MRNKNRELVDADGFDESDKTLNGSYSHVSLGVLQQGSEDLDQRNIGDFLSKGFGQLRNFLKNISELVLTAAKFLERANLIFQDLSSVAPIIMGKV